MNLPSSKIVLKGTGVLHETSRKGSNLLNDEHAKLEGLTIVSDHSKNGVDHRNFTMEQIENAIAAISDTLNSTPERQEKIAVLAQSLIVSGLVEGIEESPAGDMGMMRLTEEGIKALSAHVKGNKMAQMASLKIPNTSSMAARTGDYPNPSNPTAEKSISRTSPSRK
ncbi:hypothetical protein [Streptomyces sp. IB201691-2A2]|uniref:hypothetical protein n=1 Tax=Streptomyces sp. IB201691-2A2 TaxID=2561920 RepID=UPI00117EEAF2|nr:hypothetical protein [Streptomyces sp. IB201691-2A2]TRO55263.1 hypothetical protein E4K73_50970 [Streptomyces sp. IB201691-2A2]